MQYVIKNDGRWRGQALGLNIETHVCCTQGSKCRFILHTSQLFIRASFLGMRLILGLKNLACILL